MYPKDISSVNFKPNFFLYIIICAGISILFRALISFMKAKEAKHYKGILKEKTPELNTWHKFKLLFHGFNEVAGTPDLWYNTYIGTLELLVFPILIKFEGIVVIGAWITLKTVSQWNVWGKNRIVFNRFLIAHGLLLIAAWFLSHLVIKT